MDGPVHAGGRSARSIRVGAVHGLQQAIEGNAERLTGLAMNGADAAWLYMVDEAAAGLVEVAAAIEQAAEAGVAVRTVIVARSRARLREVQQAVLQVCRQLADLQGLSCGIDPATARVRVRVAQRHAARLREALAEHPGLAEDLGAVVVVQVPPEQGVTSLGPGPRVTRAGWPVPSVPTAEAVGQPAGDLAARYRDGGFTVVVVRYGEPAFFHLNWSRNRIRLLVRDGIVVDARQG